VPVRSNGGCDIYKVHDSAAKDIAENVGVLRKDYLRHFRARSAYGLARQVLQNRFAGSLRHLSSMRPAVSWAKFRLLNGHLPLPLGFAALARFCR
jgi:hypothetical protein